MAASRPGDMADDLAAARGEAMGRNGLAVGKARANHASLIGETGPRFTATEKAVDLGAPRLRAMPTTGRIARTRRRSKAMASVIPRRAMTRCRKSIEGGPQARRAGCFGSIQNNVEHDVDVEQRSLHRYFLRR